MSRRDDMVFRPSLGKSHQAAAPVRAREDRELLRTKRRGGIGRRLATARVARAASRRRAKKARARRLKVARSGLRGATSAAARRAAATPVGAIAAILVVAGIVGLRLISGQPLEKTGEQLNKIFLGDMDEEARARMAVRQRLSGDSEIARIVGQEGRVNSQIASIADDLFRLEKKRQDAATLFKNEFPVNSLLDNLILRFVALFKSSWKEAGGTEAVRSLESSYSKLRSKAKERGR